MPKFSFIVPVYNVEHYLRQCLDSVLNQHYADFEICIVDDGSSDSSGAICDEYAAKNGRIKLLHQPNGGVSVARNAALDMASGEFIWFVDADDYIEPDCLHYLDEIIEKSQCDTIFFGEKRIPPKLNLCFETSERHNFLCSHISYCNPLMIFKRSIIEEHLLRFTLGMKMAEDLEFQYKYLLYCEKPVSIPYSLYYIRQRSNSASRGDTAKVNNLHGNIIILKNILVYVQSFSDKGLDWLGMRMAERTKSLIQSAILTPTSDTKEINRLVRGYVKSYRSLGFAGFDDWSLRLASIDVRIYYFLYKLRFIIKRLRK